MGMEKELIQAYLRLYHIIRDIEKASFSNIPSRHKKVLLKPFPDRHYKRLSTRIKKKNSYYARQAKLSTFYANSPQYATTHQYRYVKAVMNRYWDPGLRYNWGRSGPDTPPDEEIILGLKYGKLREGHIPQSWAYKVLVFCLVWDHRMTTGKPLYPEVERILGECGIHDERGPKDIQKIYEKTSLHDIMTIIEEVIDQDLFRLDDVQPPPRSMLSEIHDLINKPYHNSLTVNGRPHIR